MTGGRVNYDSLVFGNIVINIITIGAQGSKYYNFEALCKEQTQQVLFSTSHCYNLKTYF